MSFSLSIQGWSESSAEISADGKYRYTLKRAWAPGGSLALVVGLNPSTADADKDDQTIRRLRTLLRVAGYNGFTIVNLFAFRSTDPKAMLAMGAWAIGGTRQEEVWRDGIAAASDVVVAWGALKDERAISQSRRFEDICGGARRMACSRLPNSARLEVW